MSVPQTQQELFNLVVHHARAQGCRSVHEYGGRVTCCYRGPGGLKCFFGVVIPDDKYLHEMDTFVTMGEAVWSVERIAKHIGLPESLCQLAHNLRSIHDNDDPKIWERQFGHLARSYGLSMPAKEVA